MDKIRPNATAAYDYGEDGRDPHYHILYNCPNCNKRIREKDIACDKCGTFFDWSRKARIKIVHSVVWE